VGPGDHRLRALRRPRPAPAFNIAAGGAVCPRCRPPGSIAPSRETLALLAR
jgi:DNA repair protein RecO (recombination protein O)